MSTTSFVDEPEYVIARTVAPRATAFREEGGAERHRRDARAATATAPTTEALHDFTGRAACGLPLFDQESPS
ncbi:hypothetical protein ACIQMJ_26375 [Actinosynnema sp. NPDC091369]